MLAAGRLQLLNRLRKVLSRSIHKAAAQSGTPPAAQYPLQQIDAGAIQVNKVHPRVRVTAGIVQRDSHPQRPVKIVAGVDLFGGNHCPSRLLINRDMSDARHWLKPKALGGPI